MRSWNLGDPEVGMHCFAEVRCELRIVLGTRHGMARELFCALEPRTLALLFFFRVKKGYEYYLIQGSMSKGPRHFHFRPCLECLTCYFASNSIDELVVQWFTWLTCFKAFP